MIQDKAFKPWVVKYAADEGLFFQEYVMYTLLAERAKLTTVTRSFANVFAKLLELGVPQAQYVTSEPWHMKNSDEK